MLDRAAKPAFVAACGCNLALSIMGAFRMEAAHVVIQPLILLAGAIAFSTAAILGGIILGTNDGMHRRWVKAALVFLVLGPLAFWGLQMPAVGSMLCIDCRPSEAAISHAVRDVMQGQAAMIAIALAAMLCAVRAISVTFDELAT